MSNNSFYELISNEATIALHVDIQRLSDLSPLALTDVMFSTRVFYDLLGIYLREHLCGAITEISTGSLCQYHIKDRKFNKEATEVIENAVNLLPFLLSSEKPLVLGDENYKILSDKIALSLLSNSLEVNLEQKSNTPKKIKV